MKRSIDAFFVLIFLIPFVFSSCTKSKMKESAIGKIEEIAICASNTVYSSVEKNLLDALTMEVTMPARESVFYTVFVSLDKLYIYKREKNIIFITNINRNDEYSQIINSFLSQEDLKQIKEEGALFFTIFDGFAKGQNIFIIAGVSEDELNNAIKKRKELISKFFMDNTARSLDMMVYFAGENKRLSTEIYEKTGIRIKAPSDYQTAFFDKNLNCYSIIARYPDRIVTMMTFNDTSNFRFQWMTEMRDLIGKKHFEGDRIDTQFVKLEKSETSFKGYPALEIKGTYANDKNQYGGPFIMYLIKANGKLYFLDGHIFLPGERKYFKLMETKTVMNTIELE
ncbi:MAG: DUF4837 family protein [bacterium]